MFAGDHHDRTVAPTGRRLAEARRSGAFARSSDLTAAVSIGAAIVATMLLGPQLWLAANDLLHAVWSQPLMRITDGPIPGAAESGLARLGGLVAALLAVPVCAAIIANAVQAGFRMHLHPLQIRPSAVSPWAGLRRIRAAAGWRTVGPLAIKLLLTAWLVFRAVRSVRMDASAVELRAEFIALSLQVGAALAVLALADWFSRRRAFLRGLRLTPAEARQEARDSKLKSRPRTNRPSPVSGLQLTAERIANQTISATELTATETPVLQEAGVLPTDPLFS